MAIAVVTEAPTAGPSEEEVSIRQKDGLTQSVARGTAAETSTVCSPAPKTITSRLSSFIAALRSRIWAFLEDVCEEFSPWLKWLILDALLTLVLGALARRFSSLQPLLEAVGLI